MDITGSFFFLMQSGIKHVLLKYSRLQMFKDVKLAVFLMQSGIKFIIIKYSTHILYFFLDKKWVVSVYSLEFNMFLCKYSILWMFFTVVWSRIEV